SNDIPSASLSDDSDDISDGSMSMSSDTESTSSSSSSSSNTDDGPDEIPTRPSEPLRIPPPQRKKLSAICREYRSTGRCSIGANCRFSHEMKTNAAMPETGKLADERGEPVWVKLTGSTTLKGQREKKKRKSLYQRVSSS